MTSQNHLYNNDWINFIVNFPIAFSQVREDSLIDIEIVTRLPKNANGVMIASGGCTAALLAYTNKFKKITLVDMNPSQLALSKLKLHLLENHDLVTRLKLLGHIDITSKDREYLLQPILEKLQIDIESFGPRDHVYTNGPDKIGRYELLFERLRHEINDDVATQKLLSMQNIQEQQNFIINSNYYQKLKDALFNVMALPNLVALFGSEATQNSIQPFTIHFLERTLYAINNIAASTNPYLAQMLLGKFVNNNFYPWLTLPMKKIDTAIDYNLFPFAKFLKQSSENFDLIHLSNILDWLDIDAASTLLNLAHQKLKQGGYIIIRQLNSNLLINEICPDIKWILDESVKFNKVDRSFFYTNLHIGRK